MTVQEQILADMKVGVDSLLSLRQVAELTGWNFRTLERWAYKDKRFPVEHTGPTQRVRVRFSTVRKFFPDRTRLIPRK